MNTPHIRTLPALIAGFALVGLGCTTANAQLTAAFTWSGNGDWSIDGVGGTNTPVGDVTAVVPVGSTVLKAYLYSAQYDFSEAFPTPDITLGSTEYSGASWTQLPANPSAGFLDAFRTDVTSQIQAAVGGGSASPFNFSVTENSNNDGTDGEILAIMYSNPSSPMVTMSFLDGTLPTSGASTTLTYATPLSGVGSPGFYEQVSLGDSFSYQVDSAQYTKIDVDGRRLTTSAGGNDDGEAANGGLITVGGIGDSTSNPADPFRVGGTTGDTEVSAANEFSPPNPDDTTFYDDELYDLGQGNGVDSSPFVSNGDTSTVINTINPSGDDNIFFLGLNVTALASISTNPVGTPDTSSTVGLMALALGAVAVVSLKRRTA